MNTSPLFPGTGAEGGQAKGGTLSYTVLDVFTSNPLEGNQLAVFLDGRDLSTEEMQALAREMNLSETVFLLPPEGGGDVSLRIFTPSRELPFAGHPVLGSSVVVAKVLGSNTVVAETGMGNVPVEITWDGLRNAFGRMCQPVPTAEAYERADELVTALRVSGSELPVEAYSNGPRHVFVMLGSAEEVSCVRPDYSALSDHPVGASCFAWAGDHWKTRMFAPGLGVNEDPATGSAAGPLAVHLARHGLIEFGDDIVIHQGAEIGRPSVLHARAVGSREEITRVEVGGASVVVGQGTYLVRSARSS